MLSVMTSRHIVSWLSDRLVLRYVRERGLTHARSYLNFIERTAGSCPSLSPAETAYISAFAAVTPAGDELELQRVLVEQGPVAVGMYTRYFEFDVRWKGSEGSRLLKHTSACVAKIERESNFTKSKFLKKGARQFS